jgi:hypothetical protein
VHQTFGEGSGVTGEWWLRGGERHFKTLAKVWKITKACKMRRMAIPYAARWGIHLQALVPRVNRRDL